MLTTRAALIPWEKQKRNCSVRMPMLYPERTSFPSPVSIPWIRSLPVQTTACCIAEAQEKARISRPMAGEKCSADSGTARASCMVLREVFR